MMVSDVLSLRLAFTIQKILTPYDNTQEANQSKQSEKEMSWHEEDLLEKLR